MLLKISPIEEFFLYYSAGVASVVLLWNIYTERKRFRSRLKVRYSLANFVEEKGCYLISIVQDSEKKSTNELVVTFTNVGSRDIYIYKPPMLKYYSRIKLFSKRLLSINNRYIQILYDYNFPIKLMPGEQVTLQDSNPNIPLDNLPFRIITRDSLGRRYKSGKFAKIKP